jgi:hypothetical protein
VHSRIHNYWYKLLPLDDICIKEPPHTHTKTLYKYGDKGREIWHYPAPKLQSYKTAWPRSQFQHRPSHGNFGTKMNPRLVMQSYSCLKNLLLARSLLLTCCKAPYIFCWEIPKPLTPETLEGTEQHTKYYSICDLFSQFNNFLKNASKLTTHNL